MKETEAPSQGTEWERPFYRVRKEQIQRNLNKAVGGKMSIVKKSG
jgi:hypothetical protein